MYGATCTLIVSSLNIPAKKLKKERKTKEDVLEKYMIQQKELHDE